MIVSAGTEFSLPMDRYINYALTLTSTRAIGLFMETSRDPAGLRAALTRAAELDIPVVCLKVGRGTRSREFVATHTVEHLRANDYSPPGVTGVDLYRGLQVLQDSTADEVLWMFGSELDEIEEDEDTEEESGAQ
jgi:Succinyl-CoA ligase like flavodoxin domain